MGQVAQERFLTTSRDRASRPQHQRHGAVGRDLPRAGNRSTRRPKREVLAGERPACAVERVPLDLSKLDERRAVLNQMGSRARRTLVISEGLLIYLADEAVGSLAEDLAATPGFERWGLDLASPGLLQMMQRRMGDMVSAAGAPFKFAPTEGPSFFERYGWTAIEVESLFETAARKKRLPWMLRLMSLLPQTTGPGRMWSGVCLLRRFRT